MQNFASRGLILSVLTIYLSARTKGLTERQAVQRVLKKRYPSSEEKRKLVREEFDAAIALMEKDKTETPDAHPAEDKRLKKLILVIILFENSVFNDEHYNQANDPGPLTEQIDRLFESMQHRYDYTFLK